MLDEGMLISQLLNRGSYCRGTKPCICILVLTRTVVMLVIISGALKLTQPNVARFMAKIHQQEKR